MAIRLKSAALVSEYRGLKPAEDTPLSSYQLDTDIGRRRMRERGESVSGRAECGCATSQHKNSGASYGSQRGRSCGIVWPGFKHVSLEMGGKTSL